MHSGTMMAVAEEREIAALRAHTRGLTPEQQRQQIGALVVWCLVIAGRSRCPDAVPGSPGARNDADWMEQ